MSFVRAFVFALLLGTSVIMAQSGNMLEFTGAANNVSVPHAFSGSSFGYEFWFKANAIGIPMNLVVYSAANGPMTTFSHQVRLNSAGRVQFYVYRQDLLTGITITSNRSVTPGEWVHVGVNWVDLVGGELYLDGVLDGSFNGGGVPAQVGVAWKSGVRLHLGSATGGNMSPLNGSIDELRIWEGGVGPNTFHPHATNALVSPFPAGLTDYWRFDSVISGSVANQVSGREAVQITSGATLAYSALPMFMGGTGAWNDPYQVGFAGQLNHVRNYLSWHFKQTKDIGLGQYQAGSGWLPIGDFFNPFTGTYNGQGFSISAMRQSRVSDVGLFGVISGAGAVVENLRLQGFSLWSTSVRVGSLAGYVDNQATVRSVATEGVYVYGNSNTVGGLIGRLGNGAKLFTSYSHGQVYGTQAVGGLVGNADGNSVIRDVYSYAVVNASTSGAGGIVGQVNSAVVENAYSFANPSGTSSGLMFGTHSFLTSNRLYHLITTGKSDVGSGASVSTALLADQMRVPDYFLGWDFDTIWQMTNDGHASYPYLRGIPQTPAPGYTTDPRPVLLLQPLSGASGVGLQPTIRWSGPSGQSFDIQISSSEVFAMIEVDVMALTTTSFTHSEDLDPGIRYHWRVRSRNPQTNEVGAWSTPMNFTTTISFDSGDGTTSNPYQVRTAAQLNHIRNFRTAHFIQTADISLAGFNQQTSWTPLGTMSSPFSGTFDGQHFEILDLTQTGTLSDAGLFGVIAGSAAWVKNVRLTGVNISVTGNSIGALAGWLTAQAQASGSSVEGNISGTQQVGGLFGTLNVGTTLTTSYSLATVSGSDLVGGLVGQSWEATVRNVYSLATVSATNRAGGLFGNSNSSTLQNAYADATLSGATRGQIAGSLSGSNVPSGLYFRSSPGMVGVGTGQNIAAERTPDQLRASSNFDGWDFATVWQMVQEQDRRSYPYLRSSVQAPAPGLLDGPSIPELVAPANLSTQIAVQPELSWQDALFADRYDVHISRDAGFATIDVMGSNLSATSFVPEVELTPNEVYFWRVRSSSSTTNEESDWSDARSFTTNPFASGDGSVSNPYQVSTAAQLNRVRSFRSAHFIQTAPISLDDFTDGAGWAPIATDVTPFSGTYNGQNFTISGLRQSGDLSNAGLFGVIGGSSARVLNVRLIDVNISVTGNHVGALAGWLTSQSQVSGSSVEGSISGNHQVGGLIGTLNVGTTLMTSYSLAAVSGSDMIGGLVGQPFQATVQNVYSLATVSATSNAGGLFGNAHSSTLQNAYADATVNGATRGQISGSLSGTNARFGLYFSNTSGLPAVGTGQNIATAYSPSQLRVPQLFVGWDFDTVWQNSNGESHSYPFFRGTVQSPPPGLSTDPLPVHPFAPAQNSLEVSLQPIFSWTAEAGATRYEIQIALDEAFSDLHLLVQDVNGTSFVPETRLETFQVYFWRVRSRSTEAGEGEWSPVMTFRSASFEGGVGTAADPYQVATAAQLNRVRNFLTAHFIQTADISLEDYTTGNGWVPIGTSAASFTGRYNGQFHTISNLNLSGSITEAGLFGFLRSPAIIENLRLTDVNITGTGSARGAVAGRTDRANVWRVSVSGLISGNYFVGGVIGYMNGGMIAQSYSDATVSGSDVVGGIVGTVRHSLATSLQDLYSNATVTATSADAGGIAGRVESDGVSLTLARLVSDAVVSGPVRIGMIAGSGLAPSRSASRTSVYFSTDSGVPGDGDWLSTSRTIDRMVDLPGARTRDQLRDVATFTEFDFNSGWDIKGNGEASYPFLRSIPQTPAPGYLTTPNAPKAQAPAWATTHTQPELRWSKALPADQYELQVALDTLFIGGLVIATTVSGTTYTPASPLALGVYYWRVRGMNTVSNETGAWSAPKALAIVAFPAGNGTAGDPYQVATAAQLFAAREFRSAHFRQIADIDLQPVGHWIPIGTVSTPFIGTFDGQRHAIAGLIQSGRVSNVGLFGVLSGATVSNVKFTGVQISVALDSVGALAGLATANSLVRGSSVEGSIQGRYEVGGLIGLMNGSNLFTSYTRATVTGAARAGGMVGTIRDSGLRDSYSLATVSLAGFTPELPGGSLPLQTAGGLAADLRNASVQRVYADAGVTAPNPNMAGQIAGLGFFCSTSGAVIYNAERGQAGVGSPGFPMTESYCAIGSGVSPMLMRSPDTYFGWDFTTTWQIDRVGASSYPYLRAAVQTPSPGAAAAFFAGGVGTTGDPYQVATADHLNNVRFFPNSRFIQTADISLAQIPNWQPIDPQNGFNGVYNGQQFRIVGLTITGAVHNAGLFGQTSGQYRALIENVRLVDVSIQTTGDNVGGLVGWVNTGVIRNSSVSGTVTGGVNVGGLVGFIQHYGLPFSGVYSDATVTGHHRVGGLIGYLNNFMLTNAYSLATVTANEPGYGQAGGLVGSYFNGLTLLSVYENAIVQGALADRVALGEPNDFGTPEYYAEGLVTNRTPAELRQQSTFAGWDFTNVWAMEGGDGTGSFPYLRNVPQTPAPGRIAPTVPVTFNTNPGTSLSLGSSDLVTFPVESALNPAAFTVELWVRPTTGTGVRTVLSSRNQNRGYALSIDADGAWSAWTGSATGGLSLSGGTAATDVWTHLALVHTGTEARFYVNGRLKSEGNSILQTNLSGDLVLGGFTGLMDELRLWSVARSESAIRRNLHEPILGSQAGLELLVSFDEASGTAVFDQRANSARYALINGTVAFSSEVHPAGSFIHGTQDAWYFLANPTAGVTLAQFLEPLWTQGAIGSDAPGAPGPNVFTLNETLGAYQAVTDLTVPAVPGKGYLVRVYKNDVYQVEGGFPKRLSVPRTEAPATVELPVSFTNTHAFAGFSLVGNPYPYTVDLSTNDWEFANVAPTVYVYDQSINNYRTWNRNTGIASNGGTPLIAPNQGYLIMASAPSPVARVPRTSRASMASALMKPPATPAHTRLELTLMRGDRSEQMQVLLMDDADIADVREMTRQLEPLHSDRFMVYAVDPTTGLKIETYEMSKHSATVIELPVHADISTEGENKLAFTLTGELNPDWAVMLLDTQTGTRTDLLTIPEVRFDGVTRARKAGPADSLMGTLSQTMAAESARFRLLIGPKSAMPSDEELPTAVTLAQNYPNPFNPSTVIRFTLDADRQTRLAVYDVLGREVAVLVEGPLAAGHHQFTLDASALAGGVYVYRLQTEGKVLSRKMTLIK